MDSITLQYAKEVAKQKGWTDHEITPVEFLSQASKRSFDIPKDSIAIVYSVHFIDTPTSELIAIKSTTLSQYVMCPGSGILTKAHGIHTTNVETSNTVSNFIINYLLISKK